MAADISHERFPRNGFREVSQYSANNASTSIASLWVRVITIDDSEFTSIFIYSFLIVKASGEAYQFFPATALLMTSAFAQIDVLPSPGR